MGQLILELILDWQDGSVNFKLYLFIFEEIKENFGKKYSFWFLIHDIHPIHKYISAPRATKVPQPNSTKSAPNQPQISHIQTIHKLHKCGPLNSCSHAYTPIHNRTPDAFATLSKTLPTWATDCYIFPY